MRTSYGDQKAESGHDEHCIRRSKKKHYFGISKIALKAISQVWRHWMVTAARKPVHVLIAFGEAIAIKFMLVWKIALKSTLWLLSELGCH